MIHNINSGDRTRGAYLLFFLYGLKTGKNGYNQSSASGANVHTFAQNGQFHHALKLPVLLVEATAPNPENAGITSATYAPKRSFFKFDIIAKKRLRPSWSEAAKSRIICDFQPCATMA